MSKPDLVIRYHHDTGDTCTGDLRLVWADGSAPVEVLLPFEKMGFNKMMSNASRSLNAHEIDRLLVERTDRGGLKPFVMDNPTVELLRSDPVAAIHAMNVPPIHIDMRKGRPAAPAPVFTAGVDTLAEGFGDEVYARVRNKEVECPGCGMWSPFTEGGKLNCYKKCFLSLSARYVPGWAIVSVQDLLNLNFERYFLPRGWNRTLVFISHADLSALYNQWKKEKAS